MPVAAYATTTELAAILKIRTPTTEQTTALTAVLLAAAGEIDSEIGQLETDAVPLAEAWQLALAKQVNLERAVEHWHAQPVGFAIVGLDSEAPIRLASNSWERHANVLAPLKDGTLGWGFA